MPLTKKGRKIKREMQKEYGKEKGTQVFHASRNKGTITGVERGGRRRRSSPRRASASRRTGGRRSGR